MKLLFAASESVPFMKTGGLADVAGSLPKALHALGHEVAVVLPLYRQVEEKWGKDLTYLGYDYLDMGKNRRYIGYFLKEEPWGKVYFIDCKDFFARDKLYGEEDDAARFFFFAKGVARLLSFVDFFPDLVHANDWHTGFLPLYLREYAREDPRYGKVRSLFTIHNIKYQGIFPAQTLWEDGGLSRGYYHEEGVKYYDCVNFMKAGIVYSDYISTVSKTYAEELTYDYFGEGLEGLLRKYSYRFTGILNGIDTEVYNPQGDPYLKKTYNLRTLANKDANKRHLQEKLGLPQKSLPIYAVVSRLVEMKGMDLLLHIADEFLKEEVQLVILGTGDRYYEEAFEKLQERWPEKVAAKITFSEELAHLFYGGADFLIMPSLAEPCGLAQLIAQEYGTVPVVRETGGLADTVSPYNRYTKMGTGIGFGPVNAHELLFALKKGLAYYATEDYRILQRQCMEKDNSWQKAAREYEELYEKIIRM